MNHLIQHPIHHHPRYRIFSDHNISAGSVIALGAGLSGISIGLDTIRSLSRYYDKTYQGDKWEKLSNLL